MRMVGERKNLFKYYYQYGCLVNKEFQAPYFRRKQLRDKKTDFAYWQSRPEAERLTAIETLRQQYIKYKFGNVQPFLSPDKSI